MQKKPYISFHDNDHNCRLLLSNAKVTLLHNDSLQISSQKDSFAIDCTRSYGSTYVGTWQRYEDGRGRVQGKITLWPRCNSDGEIKCFSGYIRNWNDPRTNIIKIQTFWCRCPTPSRKDL